MSEPERGKFESAPEDFHLVGLPAEPDEADISQAALEALLEIASEAEPGEDGTMSEEDWGRVQHLLDLAEGGAEGEK